MKCILIMEDSPEIGENTTEILQITGYAVKSAVDGEQGVSTALSLLPDLISFFSFLTTLLVKVEIGEDLMTIEVEEKIRVRKAN